MQKWTLALILLLLCAGLNAQRFGGTPPGVKWRQINTDTARIIFPSGLDSQAQRVAALVHDQASANAGFQISQLKKISIVLQNKTVIANGYVGLGPYRSEFYLTPPPNNFDQGSVSWLDQLAIHEYRHVQQYNHFNNGISRLMGILFGEEGYALATNASIPDWFYEGDAVYHETVGTRQGRGRLPVFMNAYPAVWQAGKDYTWMKMRNGSLKDYVPSHYQLGYWLVNHGYQSYGSDFWSKVTKDASAFQGLFYPFQKAIKKYSGVDYKTFRSDAVNSYKQLGKNLQLSSVQTQNSTRPGEGNPSYIFPVNKNYVTNYLFPYQAGADSLLYVKQTYRHRTAFYVKVGNEEHRLRTRDISADDQFSYRNGKIVYTAFENDPRWWWRDYSVIKLLDIETGQQRTLTHRSKYFTPDISENGNKIVAVEYDEDGRSSLHVLDVNSSRIEKEIRNAAVSQFSDPKFVDDNTLVTALRFQDGRMALALVDITTGNIIRLTPESFTIVGYPSVAGNNVYFTASYQGSDNIFSVNLSDRRIYKITDGSVGKYFVNAGPSGTLTWSEFTAEGYQLQQQQISSWQADEVLFKDDQKIFEAYPVATPLSPKLLSGRSVERIIPTSKYKKGTRLLNFHSWRPYYEDPEFSFSLYGQNVLNTLETELYYLYNQNDNTNAVGFNSIYGAWFPYLVGGLQYTFDRNQEIDDKTRSWDQLDARVGLSVPLSFTSGRTFKNFSAGTDYVFRSDRIKGAAKADFTNSNFSYLSHRVSFSEQVESAVQHIFPRLGYSVVAQHRHAITNFTSWQFLGNAALYLPGIASTHNLVLTGAFQQRDTVNVLFGNRFAYSRGFNEAYAARMWRGSVNYHLPIVYPDWGFANILYLLRVRANGFFDFTKLYSNDHSITADQRSAGAEIYVDTKWWNQYELSFGFRVARLLDDDLFTGRKETVFEFILPVSIFPK